MCLCGAALRRRAVSSCEAALSAAVKPGRQGADKPQAPWVARTSAIVNLITFSKQYLRLDEALPFGVRDAQGRLLLAAGQRIDNAQRLAELRGLELFADEDESSDWRRRLALTVDTMVRQNATL